MSDSMLAEQKERSAAMAFGQPQVLDKLRELTRSGYVPDPEAEVVQGALLLRHDAAPDLILLADGSIELPTVQTPRRAAAPAEAPRKRMSKRRTFAFIVMAVLFWFFSMMITASILSD